MTTDRRTHPLPADLPLDLLHHVDCVVMLLSADPSDAAAAVYCANILAKRIRVVLVSVGGTQTDAPEPVVEGRLIRVALPASPTTAQRNALNRTLRQLGLIRPLLWLEDPLHTEWFCTTYAPFKV